MRVRRFFVSVCLLLAYSTGLAHDLIPHCHHDDFTEEGSGKHADGHFHEHHSRCAAGQEDHSHIAHEDHLDEGLVDFLICVLSESSHPVSGNKVDYCIASQTIRFTGSGPNSGALVSVVFFNAGPNEVSAVPFRQERMFDRRLKYILSAPRRGPPVVSFPASSA